MKHFAEADLAWIVLDDVGLAAAEGLAATKVVLASRRKTGFLILAGLDELPDGCTPAFSINSILTLTNLNTLWIDGYSSLFSDSN